MKYTALIPCAILSTLLSAQDDRRAEGGGATPEAPRHAALSDVLGMTVRLQATPEARAAAATEGKLASRPTGSIEDLVLAADSGEAYWAAVSVGGMLGIGDRIVAVPNSALVCVPTEGKPVFELRATEAELKALPEFDLKASKGAGLSAALRSAENSWKKARPTWHAKTVEASLRKVDGAEQVVVPDSFLASHLMGCPVKSRDGKAFGSVGEGCYNLETNSVDYLVVGRGGVIGVGESHYLIPYKAGPLVFVGEDNKPSLSLAKSAAELADAPRYNKPDHGLVSEENGRQACEFYGVEHHAKTAKAISRELKK